MANSPNAQIKIYAGLSLSFDEVLAVLPTADVSGPVERFDILRDIDNGYHVIGIIDGKFFQKLAASPSEVLDAIRCGLKVYGSSSMGALRAVELEPFGMIGCGKIFELVKKTQVFRDDYLGQSFSQDDLATFSVSYVDLQFELERKVAALSINPADAETLLNSYSEIYFSERSSVALKNHLRDKYPTENRWPHVVEILFNNFQSQKKKDGLSLLLKIKNDLQLVRNQNEKLWALQAGCRSDKDFYP